MRITHKTAYAALGCALAMLSSSAFATTLNGTHVSYTFDDSELGLFGSASVSGDTLVFSPAGFVATLDETQTYKSASETVTITVEALGGYQLAGFNLSESGGYTGYTPDPVNAWIGGSLTAIDVEGNTGKQLSSAITGSELIDAGAWTGGAAISLPATGWGGSDGIVKSVTLTLSNDLLALGSAEIWKDGASIASIATPVPEAHTYAMLLAGLGLVGFMAQRKARTVI